MRAVGLNGSKPRTRDKRKRQTRFDHDPDVLTVEKIRAAVKCLELGSFKFKPMTVPPWMTQTLEELDTPVIDVETVTSDGENWWSGGDL